MGENKYGLSGAMMAYIDKHYGRETLIALMPLTDVKDVLQMLETTEDGLISGWKEWLLNTQLTNGGR